MERTRPNAPMKRVNPIIRSHRRPGRAAAEYSEGVRGRRADGAGRFQPAILALRSGDGGAVAAVRGPTLGDAAGRAGPPPAQPVELLPVPVGRQVAAGVAVSLAVRPDPRAGRCPRADLGAGR